MPDLNVVEIKAFVPATELSLSKQFYEDLGFEVAWSDEGLAYLRSGASSFLLQQVDDPAHAAQMMMHLLVEDVGAWWDHVVANDLVGRYGVRSVEPDDRPWGIRDFVLTDPTGVLWRIGQNIGGRHGSA